MDTPQTNPPNNHHNSTQPAHVPEKYLIAFVIQGDDVFKITADNIIHTTGTADGPAFDAIAKLKAAAALLELTNRHKERPTELRKMARELAGEGMKLMAAASASIRPAPAPEEPAAERSTDAPSDRTADRAQPRFENVPASASPATAGMEQPTAPPAVARTVPRIVIPLAPADEPRLASQPLQAHAANTAPASTAPDDPASGHAFATNARIALIPT